MTPIETAAREMTANEMLARVLYRDGLMLVIDKPAGLPVHRGPKGGTSLEDYFDALRYGLPRAPALAHRLDKETSGCLVLGRHRKALAHLGLLFKHGRVGKTYWAVVEGGPDADAGTIDLPLGRLDATRGWWMKPDPQGLPSVTAWRVMGRGGAGAESLADLGMAVPVAQPAPSPPASGRTTRGEGTGPLLGEGVASSREETASSPRPKFTWLALEPLTGRTHQLRVHCAAMGWPILGDNIYGTAPRFGGPGLHLHAREVIVPIAKNRAPVHVTAPVAAHMRARLVACGWNRE
jgi:tRNA pseudouridine32 synthase/23S rRNA pseudouridine746 synthase